MPATRSLTIDLTFSDPDVDMTTVVYNVTTALQRQIDNSFLVNRSSTAFTEEVVVTYAPGDNAPPIQRTVIYNPARLRQRRAEGLPNNVAINL